MGRKKCVSGELLSSFSACQLPGPHCHLLSKGSWQTITLFFVPYNTKLHSSFLCKLELHQYKIQIYRIFSTRTFPVALVISVISMNSLPPCSPHSICLGVPFFIITRTEKFCFKESAKKPLRIGNNGITSSE